MRNPVDVLATAATVPEILDAFIKEVGGPEAFAKMIATDFTDADRGSANSIRLATAILKLMSQTPQGEDDNDLEALEAEREYLSRCLQRGDHGED